MSPFAELHPTIYRVLAGLIGMLVVVTVIVAWKERGKSRTSELWLRVTSWWTILTLFAGSILLGIKGTLWLLGFVSFLALKEYFSLIPTRRSDRRVLFWAYLAIPLQYYWVYIGWFGMFLIFIPVYLFLLIPLRKVLIGGTEGFLRSVGTIHWGLMITVFSLSHAGYLMVLPASVSPVGGAGLLLFLVVLTELNDVMQYVWGKSLGHRKVAPSVSPGKTWGGLAGGIGSTMLLAWIAAPWLTPFNDTQALAAGLLIGMFGFIGDITLSAVKRDIGIKDSGQLIPGHGGILDRVDSLTYTAPLFFHYLYFLHY
jgi:phosphatidate cytidylyltransferase